MGIYSKRIVSFITAVSILILQTPIQTVAQTENVTVPVTADEFTDMPSNPIENDLMNTFGFTPVKEYPDSVSYEYSIDGGNTYLDCTGNPQQLPDEDFAVGQVRVRLKAPSIEAAPYEALVNEQAYTKGTGLVQTYEKDEDLNLWTIATGIKEISSEQSRSGLHSLLFKPNASGKFNMMQDLKATYEKAIVTVWFLDELQDINQESVQVNVSNSKAGTGTGGVNNNAEKISFKIGKEYQYRLMNGTTENTGIKRTKGWHQITFDYTNGTQAVLKLDGQVLVSMASTGFDFISIQDSWSKSNYGQKYYFDDISVSTTEEIVAIPQAPSNFVGDDENNTFGFTPCSSNPDAIDYEYSTDFGTTFIECTGNPQTLKDLAYAKGQILVRLKAINGQQPGAVLRSNQEFTISSNVSMEKLIDTISFASTLFANDYAQDDTYQAFMTALNNAKTITDQSIPAEISSAQIQLESAMDALTPIIKDDTVYNFETGQELDCPFEAVAGTLDKSGSPSVLGEDWFDDYNNRHAANLTAEVIDGKWYGKAAYTVTKPLTNKVVSIRLNTIKNMAQNTDVFIHDQNGNEVGLRSTAGNQTHLIIYSRVNGVETSYDTDIRRLDNWHKITWDFANTDGGVTIYLDDRYMTKVNGITSFNQLSLTNYGATYDANSTAVISTQFDQLIIREKNPVKSIEIADDEATVGYYDTYDFPPALLKVTTEKPYVTTDYYTYTSDHDDIVHVTTEGSCEGSKVGTAMVTVTSTSGASDSIKINVTDKKAESVFITDASIVDINAMGAVGQDINDSYPVEKLKEIVIRPAESKVLNVVIKPQGTTKRLVNWKSSDDNIVHVRDGLITAIKPGKATITITTQDGTELSDTCTVIVAEKKDTNVVSIFVATDGDDYSGDGTIEHPFATLERARDEARSLCGYIPNGGATIYVRGGIYQFTETLSLDQQDSGSSETPIHYEAYNGEEVTFSGGLVAETEKIQQLKSDDKMYSRIPETVRDQVYTVDLKGFKFRDLQVVGHSAGSLKKAASAYNIFQNVNFNNPYYSVYFNDEPMTLCRYPNSGFYKISSVVNTGKYSRVWEADMVTAGKGEVYEPGFENDTFAFKCSAIPAEKYQQWQASIDAKNGGAWMFGYWGSVFSNMTVPIQSISSDGTIKSDLISCYQLSKNNQFYIMNLIEEMDTPGEWYIDESDKEHLKLYLIPPTGTDMTKADNKVSIPLLTSKMITMYDTNYITFTGIDFNAADGGIVDITGGTHNVIDDAKIANINGKLGTIDNSDDQIARYNGFSMCDIKNIDGGVSLGGGVRQTLERGYNFVENCTFDNISLVNTSYNPAVSLSGVGNRVSNTAISNSPHNAIMFSGPESVMEFLEIYNVMKTSGDQGGIYTGRDTLNRGSVIRNSFFHSIENTTVVDNSAIYLDDAKGGVVISDNIIEDSTWGIKVSAGRDVALIGNTIINCQQGVTLTSHVNNGPYYTYVHGLALLCSPSNYDEKCDVNWWDTNSAWGRFKHLAYILQDNINRGKYTSAIDNTFINIYNPKPDAKETIKNDNLYTKDWDIQSYETQRFILSDWMYEKNNNLSQTGMEVTKEWDNPEYRNHYQVITEIGEGKGTVAGSRLKLIQGVECKVTADPDYGYVFKNWTDGSGKVISTNPTYFFNVDGNITLKANFEAEE